MGEPSRTFTLLRMARNSGMIILHSKEFCLNADLMKELR
jgi:hypothetical protein